MKLKVIILLLLTISLNTVGQELRQPLKGNVLEFQAPIPNAHVYNLSTLNGTSTLDDGSFELMVKLNDTLIVSHIKYRSLRIVLTKGYFEKSPLHIYMEEMTNYLDIVTLINHDLTGDLSTDSEKKGKVTSRDSIAALYQDLGKQRTLGDFNRNLEKPILNQTDVTQGTNQTYAQVQKIGFKYKDVELRKELSLKKKFPEYLIADLGLPYFTTKLDIPEDKVYHFITYCEFKDIRELYYANNIIKVLTIMEAESIEYLKIKE